LTQGKIISIINFLSLTSKVCAATLTQKRKH